MSTRRLLVLGGTGQVGTELRRLALPSGWSVVAPTRAELDLARPEQIADYIAAGGFAGVVNAAAYTAVDKAETEVAAAWTANALAPAAIGDASRRAGVPIVHVSTDYVFDGAREGAWEVGDPVAPINVYGASKEGGEQAIRTTNLRHAIVRTAWVVSAQGSNFVKTMLRLAHDRPSLSVVADQHGSPTSAADLARALATVAIRLADDADAATGTFHFANAGATTWYDFARAIFAGAAARGAPAAEVTGITTADYPTPARRPTNSLLSTARITEAYGIVPRPWTQALDDILDEVIGTRKDLGA